MAMDDIYRLVQAVLIDARMTRPSMIGINGQPVGKWIEAEVLNVCVTADHPKGVVNGFVWFKLKGSPNPNDKYPKDATFHQLWLEGWTTFEWRECVTKTRKG